MSIVAAPTSMPVGIDSNRSASLFRWNLGLAILHGIQFLAMLALSFAKDPLVSSPVVSSYLRFEPSTRTLVEAQRPLFDLPIGPTVALFFLLSAIAHFSVAVPFRGWYERNLVRGQNPARWIEYAFSSSVMIVVIAGLTGIREIGTLVAIFGVNAAMISSAGAWRSPTRADSASNGSTTCSAASRVPCRGSSSASPS